jgi:hypothetical protein
MITALIEQGLCQDIARLTILMKYGISIQIIYKYIR